MTLFVVATPIGNLADLTERARHILATVPVVFAEDTRRTAILLKHLGVRPRLLSYHHHTTPRRLQSLIDLLETGDAAVVTDAGTPGVSDPGGQLVARVVERFGDRLRVVPVPGPSAVVAAASVSGVPTDTFLFLGFPPHKKGRQAFFDRLSATAETVIFYESPHRIVRAIEAIASRQPERRLVVARELTKQFETLYRGTAQELAERLRGEAARGEYVVVAAPAAPATEGWG